MKGLIMKYFVLKPDLKNSYGQASIRAIRTYANEIEHENLQLAKDLRQWMSNIETKKTEEK